MKVYVLSMEEGRYSDYGYTLMGVYSTLELAKAAVHFPATTWLNLQEVEDPRFAPDRPTWEYLRKVRYDVQQFRIEEWTVDS